jgi:hypothetical protein
VNKTRYHELIEAAADLANLHGCLADYPNVTDHEVAAALRALAPIKARLEAAVIRARAETFLAECEARREREGV